jgi:SNF2 family DNA or RNA helicase
LVNAEKVVTPNGKQWIKVSLTPHPIVIDAMSKVKGALFNTKTNFWAVPYEYVNDFVSKMADYLIVWKGEDEPLIYTQGITEDDIPSSPVVPGYTVQYDSEGNITGSTGFKTTPWGEFQVKGFNLMVSRDFLILADDAGLGKSWQVANAMEAKKRLGAVKRGVVVCKASLLFNWRDEIHMHTHQKAVVVAGSQTQRNAAYNQLTYSDDWTFIVVSYETFRSDINNFQLLDNMKPLDFCILDEAHKIKNPQSKIGAYIHRIPFRCRYVLTATPLPNSPLESYNYLYWGNVIQSNWWSFRNRYAIMGGYNKREIIAYQNIRELRSWIQYNMLRRLKKDKLKELPDVAFKRVTIPMSAKQAYYYKAVKQEIMEDLKDTSLERVPTALTKLLRLQQVTDSPELIGVEDGKPAKITALEEMLENIIDESGNKVIVFSRFRGMVELITKKFEKYNPAIIHGDVDANGMSILSASKVLRDRLGADKWALLTQEEREKLLEEAMTSERQREVYKFQNDDTCKLFIGCTPACREGLTLTAATHVIFLDCEWSPAYVEQAYSRAHRIGQKDAVTVYYLVCENTIDEYVQDVLERKDEMAQTMLDNGVKAFGEQRARNLIAQMIGMALEEVA